ncbi:MULTISPECIES: RNase P modulator RnpM [Bacillaceae]|uniref:RNase P modulator RnpM n=1 Tax=Bacillaceae TaxID=186817 RepID=UPI0009F81A26|nr:MULTISPECIES: YlxR family protein [Bacillaceae]
MKKRKVPLRKCIATGEMKAKKELIRVVRSPEGEVSVDPGGKMNGRGAYLTNSEESFLQAKQKDLLSRHLKVKLSAEEYDRLEQERQKAGRK